MNFDSNLNQNIYAELLKSEKWKHKRSEIISRDNNRCIYCQNKNLILDTICSNHISFRPLNGKILIIDKDKNIYNYINSDFASFVKINSGKRIPLISFSIVDEKYYLNGIGFYENSNIISRLDGNIRIDEENVLVNNMDKISWLYISGLHVHHTYYRLDLKPWEYNNDSLFTICWICHEKLHKDQKVKIYNEQNILIDEYTPCYRCFGAGEFPQFRHVEKGICFRCSGAKFEELIR